MAAAAAEASLLKARAPVVSYRLAGLRMELARAFDRQQTMNELEVASDNNEHDNTATKTQPGPFILLIQQRPHNDNNNNNGKRESRRRFSRGQPPTPQTTTTTTTALQS